MNPTIDPSRVPGAVHELGQTLRAAGKRSWIVGGCVRDQLLGRKVSDWDLCTDAKPHELITIFPRAIPTGLAHGTVTVVRNRCHYEITTLRGDGAYTDGRHPDSVTFVDDIEADLARRDFTINAMAADTQAFDLVDPFGGREDLSRRVIRAVGDPLLRFSEDGLRVLRAARFVSTLEMSLDDTTRAAIASTLDTFRKVALERVRDEWHKTMKAREPSHAFRIMEQSGVLSIISPELAAMATRPCADPSVGTQWEHVLRRLDACEADPWLRMSALLLDLEVPVADRLAARLKLSHDERARLVGHVRYARVPYERELCDADVRRWLQSLDRVVADDVISLCRSELLAAPSPSLSSLELLSRFAERVRDISRGAILRVSELSIDGEVLMTELGLSRGKRVGDTLKHLLALVVEDPAENERARLLSHARAFLDAELPEGSPRLG